MDPEEVLLHAFVGIAFQHVADTDLKLPRKLISALMRETGTRIRIALVEVDDVGQRLEVGAVPLVDGFKDDHLLAARGSRGLFHDEPL